MSQHDCLIWVGQSYPTIDDYLNEAGARGCCRKVPFWPAWARRSETRIFLAHHHGLATPDRGVIFGYFVLGGVDIVLTPDDFEEFKVILEACWELDGEPELTRRAYWDTEKGRKCAQLMIDFWRQRAPDDPLPFRLRDWKGDLEDFIHFLLDLFVHAGGHGFGPCALALPTSQAALETSRFCPVDGLRTAPDKSGRPSFYFVDLLARAIDEIFAEHLEERVRRGLEDGTWRSRRESLKSLVAEAASQDDNGHRRGLPEYRRAIGEARARVEELDLPLRPYEKRHGSMAVFNTPYPFYKSIPQASFRGLVQIDGDALIEQVDRAYRRRSRSREVKLPYIVEPSDKSTSKRKEELIVEMSTELKLSKSYSERILDWLPEVVADELRDRRVIRLPNIGTLRVRGKEEVESPADSHADEMIEFTPCKALTREFGEIEFTVSPTLGKRV